MIDRDLFINWLHNNDDFSFSDEECVNALEDFDSKEVPGDVIALRLMFENTPIPF